MSYVSFHEDACVFGSLMSTTHWFGSDLAKYTHTLIPIDIHNMSIYDRSISVNVLIGLIIFHRWSNYLIQSTLYATHLNDANVQLNYMTCFVTLVVCIHSFLVIHPKTVSQQSKLHELEDIFVSMSVISAALRYNINQTLTWLHFWIRFPCRKPQPQKPMRCGLVIIQSSLSIPPTVSSHRPALYSSAGTAHTDAGCNRNQTGELENRNNIWKKNMSRIVSHHFWCVWTLPFKHTCHKIIIHT